MGWNVAPECYIIFANRLRVVKTIRIYQFRELIKRNQPVYLVKKIGASFRELIGNIGKCSRGPSVI